MSRYKKDTTLKSTSKIGCILILCQKTLLYTHLFILLMTALFTLSFLVINVDAYSMGRKANVDEVINTPDTMAVVINDDLAIFMVDGLQDEVSLKATPAFSDQLAAENLSKVISPKEETVKPANPTISIETTAQPKDATEAVRPIANSTLASSITIPPLGDMQVSAECGKYSDKDCSTNNADATVAAHVRPMRLDNDETDIFSKDIPIDNFTNKYELRQGSIVPPLSTPEEVVMHENLWGISGFDKAPQSAFFIDNQYTDQVVPLNQGEYPLTFLNENIAGAYLYTEFASGACECYTSQEVKAFQKNDGSYLFLKMSIDNCPFSYTLTASEPLVDILPRELTSDSFMHKGTKTSSWSQAFFHLSASFSSISNEIDLELVILPVGLVLPSSQELYLQLGSRSEFVIDKTPSTTLPTSQPTTKLIPPDPANMQLAVPLTPAYLRIADWDTDDFFSLDMLKMAELRDFSDLDQDTLDQLTNLINQSSYVNKYYGPLEAFSRSLVLAYQYYDAYRQLDYKGVILTWDPESGTFKIKNFVPLQHLDFADFLRRISWWMFFC